MQACIRNVFDQYRSPENRLSHGLAVCLAEDRKLLRGFLQVFAPRFAPDARGLQILEQGLPGEEESSEDEAERRGLPDICIHDGETRALAIESKVEAPLTSSQLLRHRHTLARRGFDHIHVLAITAGARKEPVPDGVRQMEWADIYEWCWGQAARSEWAGRLARYLEVAEGRFVEEDYLKTASLTRFSGIPFGPDLPYTYQEGKRVLRLAMGEMRRRRDLRAELGITQQPGRGMITGHGRERVWDFIPLRAAARARKFTEFPHLNLVIGASEVSASIIIPNGMLPRFRGNLVGLTWPGFRQLCLKIERHLRPVIRKAGKASPTVAAYQRHFPSRTSPSILDARVQADLRTLVGGEGGNGGRGGIKYQPQWIEAAYSAYANRRSNIEMSFGVSFPYNGCPPIRRRKESLELIAGAWIACKPLIAVLFR